MAGKGNTRIKDFLLKNKTSQETITAKQMSNFEKVDEEIQRRLSATQKASEIIKSNVVNISSIAKATGISNKTFYNNSLLRKFVEEYSSKDEEKNISKIEYLKLKEEKEILENRIQKLIIRDIDIETKQQEINNLLREIESLKTYNKNLRELLAEKQVELAVQTSNKVVPITKQQK